MAELCGWCSKGLVRPEFLAGELWVGDCPSCKEHRSSKLAQAQPADCQKNPFHLCPGGTNKSCDCLCHGAGFHGFLKREATPKPKLVLRRRKPNGKKVQAT